ncbi:MAG: SWIM zinc finger family protein, partial [Phycisphaerales bacterium]
RLSLPHLSREQWIEVVRAMAREAVFAAKLLVGEMPESIEAPFSACGCALLPREAPELAVECNCGEKLPCKHVVAVTYLLAERLEVDPLALFSLRGLDGPTLLERLQEARTVHTTGVTQSHQSPQLPSQKAQLPPLEACLDDFWRPGRKLADFEQLPAQAHVPHALLRRLGASPLGGRFPMVGLLASIQDSLRADALELRRRIEEGQA